MTAWGLKAIAHAFNPETDRADKFVISQDIRKALKANKNAWKHFQKMPLSYRRIRIAYIESRKRHGMNMYKKSLANFVKMTAQNKRIGFVQERK